MTLEEIGEFHREIVNKNVDEKHNLFVWAVDKFLHQTEEMFEGMGYKLHARIVWDKENGIAPAFTVRFAHEYLLWFYRPGNMLMPIVEQRGKYTTVIREPSTYHSKKPEAAYSMLEAMFPDTKKIELFARNYREGWDSFGDELTQEEEVELSA